MSDWAHTTLADIRAQVADALLDEEAATADLYAAASGPPIPEFVRTTEVPHADLLAVMRASGFAVEPYRPGVQGRRGLRLFAGIGHRRAR